MESSHYSGPSQKCSVGLRSGLCANQKGMPCGPCFVYNFVRTKKFGPLTSIEEEKLVYLYEWHRALTSKIRVPILKWDVQ